MYKKIVLLNNLEEIPKINILVEQITEELNLTPTVSMSICLALEEAIANVIMYAYPPEEKNEIQLSVDYENEELTFLLTDTGKPFDPTKEKDPNISLSLEERPIGGLGIMLIKKIMNSVSYQYTNGMNQLTMKIRINEHKN